MKKLSLWGLPAALLTGLAIAGASANTPVTATASAATSNVTESIKSIALPAENSFQLAQATESFCRRVKAPSGLIVRQEPNPNSARVGGIAFDTPVTLVQGFEGIKGPDGRIWIEVASPVRGYVSNGYPGQSNLGYCTERIGAAPANTTGTTTTQNLCREVNARTAPRGLAIREEPSSTSTYKGGVRAGQEVTLVEGFQLVPDRNNQARDWVQITYPISGYVSAANLTQCP